MSQIEARILQQDYVLTCPEGQEEDLLSAVARVDADMERIRNTGKVRARERIGVLTAVNLAYENLVLHTRTQELEQELELSLEENLRTAPSEVKVDTAVDTGEALALATPSEAVETLMMELQDLLALREQELQQAQALIHRLEAALEVDSKLL